MRHLVCDTEVEPLGVLRNANAAGALADLRGRKGHAPHSGSKFFPFYAVFWEILAESYVGAPLEGWRSHLGGYPGSATEEGTLAFIFCQSAQKPIKLRNFGLLGEPKFFYEDPPLIGCFSSCRHSTVKAGPAAVEPAQQSHGTRTNHVTAPGQGHQKLRRTTGSWWCTTRRTTLTLTLVYDLQSVRLVIMLVLLIGK